MRGAFSWIASSRVLALAGLGALLTWAYFPTLMQLADRWSSDPQYSHGYLVPLFALAMLWLRREQLIGSACDSHSWYGIVLVALAATMHLVGTYIYFSYLNALSILPALAGLCVLVGGWPVLRRSWILIIYLMYMIPLPHRVETAMGQPLRRLATLASTYLLQTLGVPALAEGNIIRLKETSIGIVEACSGLSMLLVFFALATAVVIITKRPFMERIIILASAVPIALAANVTRIILTGILHETVGSKIANIVFHDLAGWLMMPVALVLLALEVLFLSRLFVELAPSGPQWTGPRAASSSRSAPINGKASPRSDRRRKRQRSSRLSQR